MIRRLFKSSSRIGLRFIISLFRKPRALPGIDAEFAKQVDAFIQQYRPALDELAK